MTPQSASRLPYVWGATDAEVADRYSCDDLATPASARFVRAVDVAATAATVFAWLGNLRVAPYSYDWIDNLGRRSPASLRDDLPALAVGQRVMTMFTVQVVVPDRELSLDTHRGPGRTLFGQVWVTYAIRESSPGVRLIAVVRSGGGGRLDTARTAALGWGDLVMMRKQLLTLKQLAERS